MGGLGYEYVLRETVGLAAGLGGMGNPYSGFAVFPLNGAFHTARGREGRLEPFLTAGYTRAAEEVAVNMFNFWAGLNYWFHRRLGLRLELRDHLYREPRTVWHFWGLRIGLGIH